MRNFLSTLCIAALSNHLAGERVGSLLVSSCATVSQFKTSVAMSKYDMCHFMTKHRLELGISKAPQGPTLLGQHNSTSPSDRPSRLRYGMEISQTTTLC